MKIRFAYNKKNNIHYLIMLAVAIVLYYLTNYKLWVLFGFAGLYFVVINLKIEPSSKLAYLWTALLCWADSVISVHVIQHIILDREGFARTSKHVLHLNMFCVAVLFLVIFIITASARWSFIISHSICIGLGMTDFYVYLFRQNEFSFADLRAVGTGLSVSGGYRAIFPQNAGYAILLAILMFSVVLQFKLEFKRKWLARVIGAAVMVLISVHIQNQTKNMATQSWELKGSYQNGYILNFWLGFRDTVFIEKPADYSVDTVKQLEEQYGGDTSTASSDGSSVSADSTSSSEESSALAGSTSSSEAASVSADSSSSSDQSTASGNGDSSTADSGQTNSVVRDSSVKDPTVIVIMNESFADLTTVGDFTTNKEVMPFINSLKENTSKGYALSSVYGAKTPNSEWEYLTGNTMAFLPEGSVVYQQYLSKKPYSLVSTMKMNGYTAVGMHPYYSTGWSRNSVYPRLGFDETHFIDDFDQTNIMREYITDQELYDKMIDRYEESKEKGEKLFLFGVTMQNHGGYRTTYANFNEDVYPYNSYYYDVRQYLSLIRHSDDAVKNLITYFQNVDDPVEIVFFGDHQPSLNAGFYQKLNGKGLSGLTMDELEDIYKVPYFIWTNYDTEEETIDATSLNYLSTMTLERGNFTLPAYSKFLKDVQKEIPSINSRGYYSKSTGHYIHIEDAKGEEKEWIEKYRTLQYNSMFDKKHRSSVFFPYYKDVEDG